jgi:hypothetical protein
VTKALAPEVLPATKSIDDLGQRVVNLHTMAGQCASMAVYCAAAAGAVMLLQKKQLKHGEFVPWVDRLCGTSGFSQRTAYNYMSLAEQMSWRIKALPSATRKSLMRASSDFPHVGNLQRVANLKGEANKDGANATGVPNFQRALPMIEVLAALDPAKIEELRQAPVLDLIRKVTNDQNLRQLYFDWGIMREQPKLGGHHPSKKPKLTAAQILELEKAENRETWTHLLITLKFQGLERASWIDFSKSERIEIEAVLDDVIKKIRASLR